MPCACIQDLPTYPQNDEWGPHMWRILHTLAELSGKQTYFGSEADEKRAWPLFMKTLVPVIPCPYCKEHFQTWLSNHPFNLPPSYYEWNGFIRNWFYTVHEDVNRRLEKPSFPIGELASTYSNGGALKEAFAILEKNQQRAIKMGGVSLLAWKAWLKQLQMLRSIFGV